VIGSSAGGLMSLFCVCRDRGFKIFLPLGPPPRRSPLPVRLGSAAIPRNAAVTQLSLHATLQPYETLRQFATSTSYLDNQSATDVSVSCSSAAVPAPFTSAQDTFQYVCQPIYR
jgi:hypothetical protein